MATVITVQTDTREKCVAEVDWQVEHRGGRPVLAPILPIGSARWIARVAIPEPQPAPVQR